MLKRWLRYLWTNEDGFFGIGMGPSGGEKTQAGAIGSVANFATSEGMADVGASDKFWRAILSGDPGQISQVLGTAISSANRQGQEAKKTASEFGTRSGGTSAGMQMTDDKTRSDVESLIANLTGKAAGALGSSGSGLLSTGLSGHEAAFDASKTMHDENLAKWNDIFKSTADVAGAAATGGSSLAAPKAAFPNMSPGMISGAYGGPTSAPTTTSDLGWGL
jgi:hypothetical protein